MRLIGDEIHYEGQLAAILSCELTPTVRERFETQIRESEDGLEADIYKELRNAALMKSRGGLLKLADLDAIIHKLQNGG